MTVVYLPCDAAPALAPAPAPRHVHHRVHHIRHAKPRQCDCAGGGGGWSSYVAQPVYSPPHAIVATPEPATWAMLIVGAVAVVAVRKWARA